jgi:hypothetical protein
MTFQERDRGPDASPDLVFKGVVLSFLENAGKSILN